MSISPIYVGQTHRPISATWTDDQGVAVDLSTATVTARLQRTGGTAFSGAGTVAILNGPGGTFTYTLAASDIATTGFYLLQFVATWSDGSELLADPVQMEVRAPI